jgi:alpha-L-fucosidase
VPAPEWFQDAKFGVYWHWGALTTPQFGSEWYGRDMYRPGSCPETRFAGREVRPGGLGQDPRLYGQPPRAEEDALWLAKLKEVVNRWSYTEGIGYYSSTQMIHALVDRVSKNGDMLLNISPTLEGTIPDEQRAVLADIGTYLRRVGESIYATRAWDTYGEGPTKMGGGSFVAPKVGTARDIRFTRDKEECVLYATVLASCWARKPASRWNYRGTPAALAVGTYTAAQLPRSIASLWPADGYEARGYPGDNLTGTPTTFTGPPPTYARGSSRYA